MLRAAPGIRCGLVLEGDWRLILISYFVSFDLLPHFFKVRKIQIESFPKALFGCRVSVTTDKHWSASTLGIRREHVTVRDLWVGEEFSISRSRNAGIEQAVALGAEWLVSLDADYVLIDPIRLWPTTGFGNIKIRFQAPGESMARSMELLCGPLLHDGPITTHCQLENHNRRLGSMGITPSGFILHRSLFTKYRFDESYVGYGSEDAEFSERLRRDGIIHSDCDAKAIHLWHAPRNHSRGRINERKEFLSRPKS